MPPGVGRYPVGVVTGLASETRIVEDLARDGLPADRRPLVVCAGASAARAGRLAESLLDQGARGLLSFGIAGGLDPRVETGQTVLADSLFTPEHHVLPCDQAWRAALTEAALAQGLAFRSGRMAGSDSILSTAAAKAALHGLCDALAVDMESHAVAAVAYRAKIPFIALRAVADPASDGLPAIVHGSVDRQGRPRAILVAARLAFRPWDLGRLGRLRDRSQAAHNALAGLGPIAPVLFGSP